MNCLSLSLSRLSVRACVRAHTKFAPAHAASSWVKLGHALSRFLRSCAASARVADRKGAGRRLMRARRREIRPVEGGKERTNVHQTLYTTSWSARVEAPPPKSRETRARNGTGEQREKKEERDRKRETVSTDRHRCRCARSRNTDGGESVRRGAARSCTRTADDFRTTERASEQVRETDRRRWGEAARRSHYV